MFFQNRKTIIWITTIVTIPALHKHTTSKILNVQPLNATLTHQFSPVSSYFMSGSATSVRFPTAQTARHPYQNQLPQCSSRSLPPNFLAAGQMIVPATSNPTSKFPTSKFPPNAEVAGHPYHHASPVLKQLTMI